MHARAQRLFTVSLCVVGVKCHRAGVLPCSGQVHFAASNHRTESDYTEACGKLGALECTLMGCVATSDTPSRECWFPTRLRHLFCPGHKRPQYTGLACIGPLQYLLSVRGVRAQQPTLLQQAVACLQRVTTVAT